MVELLFLIRKLVEVVRDEIKIISYILHRYLIPADDEQSKIQFYCCQQQSQKVSLNVRFLPFKSNPDRNLIFNSRQA